MAEKPILEIKNLCAVYEKNEAVIDVLKGVNLKILPGDIVGVVGASGSGKSVLAWSIFGLLPRPGRITEGQVIFQDQDLLSLQDEELRRLRGAAISLIIPNPRNDLNPLLTIGTQLINAYRQHHVASKSDAAKLAINMLSSVGIPSPEERMHAYPHEMSGGMAQRVVIAAALINSPKLVIADEPTFGLDVTIQMQILDLIKELAEDTNLAMLLITRDLGIVAQYCQRVAFLHSGQIVEFKDVDEFFTNPKHPRSKELITAATYAATKHNNIGI
jgi:ABC-type dipeptide/oligopeptide/nickel transport system ATPase component